MLLKVIFITVTRCFSLLVLTILRNSPNFVDHLVYIAVFDTVALLLSIVAIDFVYPWLRVVRISLERNRDARLVAQGADEV